MHGCSLDWSNYQLCIGSNSQSYDPIIDLETLLGHSIDREAIITEQNVRSLRLLEGNPILPGVADTLHNAKRAGLKVAIASSSDLNWVQTNLQRLGIWDIFDCVITSENVEYVKPAPDLFISAANSLGLQPNEVIVFEDSLNGIKAAKEAGMFCVAIPNAVTAGLDLDGADLVLTRLDAITFEQLIKAPQNHLATNDSTKVS